MNKAIKILCTLGPSSLNKETIEKLSARGVDYFRINMSHTSLDQLKQHISTIQEYSDIPICIDSEGAQVRTGFMPDATVLKDRQSVALVPGRVRGNANKIGLWPEIIFSQLKLGTVLTVDFDSVLLLVTEIGENGVEATVINGGTVGNNKAVTIFPAPTLPPLSEKDIDAVKVGLEHGLKDFALSFANSADDVKELRKLAGEKSSIISKIESKKAVHNLDSILECSDAILIDRGDLSREVPLENMPLIQKMIIKKANSTNTNVYVATNLLESMMVNRKPTRAELNDVMNTLIDGANGLVLAAETAIGKQPVPAIDMLRTLIERYSESLDGYRITDLLGQKSLLLPEMHGSSGKVDIENNDLIDSSLPDYSHEYDSIEIDENTFLDVIQIVQGVYSPLRGFMNQDDLESVLDQYTLSNGQVWTLPIILQIDEEKWRMLKTGMTVMLSSGANQTSQVILNITQLYEMDLQSVSQRWFGTTDQKHPGVARLLSLGPYVVGGEIVHCNLKNELRSPYFLTPDQTRMIFSIKGWSRVVAFHTRNVPHRAHEYLMRKAIEKSNGDGLLIQPVVGPKKKGDFVSDVILGAYDIFIKLYFPGALLTTFATYSRYSGPREAVFTALCRKNYGCTHFIIGRDHTGVGDFYEAKSAGDLFDELGDIGINIIKFDKVIYSESSNEMIEQGKLTDGEGAKSISGSEIRDALRQGAPIPESVMRKEIAAYLGERIDKGHELFV